MLRAQIVRQKNDVIFAAIHVANDLEANKLYQITSLVHKNKNTNGFNYSVWLITVGDAIKVTFRPNKTGGKRTV